MTGEKVCGTCKYCKVANKEDKDYKKHCQDCRMIIEMTNWEPKEEEDDEREH